MKKNSSGIEHVRLDSRRPGRRRAVAHKVEGDHSDAQLASLLTRLQVATDATEIRLLSERVERVVFHKQFERA